MQQRITPKFLTEKQRQERASTPMHRLPQCHLRNPRVECQNARQVNQYDTPIVTTSIHMQDIYQVLSNP